MTDDRIAMKSGPQRFDPDTKIWERVFMDRGALSVMDSCHDPIMAPGREDGLPCGDCDGCLAWLGSEEANPVV